MKRFVFFLTFFAIPFIGANETLPTIYEQDEMEILDELIAMTKKSLNEQEKLLKEVSHYKIARENFLTDPESAKYATSLVRAALAITRSLKEGNWAHLFSKEFLEEVAFYSQVGRQYGLR